MSSEIMKKLDEISANLGGRLDTIDQWARGINNRVDTLERDSVSKRDLRDEISRSLDGAIDPQYRKPHWAWRAGKEVLRGGAILAIGAGIRWVFSPSKRVKELAPMEVTMPGGTKVRELRPS